MCPVYRVEVRQLSSINFISIQSVITGTSIRRTATATKARRQHEKPLPVCQGSQRDYNADILGSVYISTRPLPMS